MGFSLKNLLNQATAQVNPFDNGATAATVRKQQSVPPARPPVKSGSLQVAQVQRPQLVTTPNIQQQPMHVTVAAPQNLQMGNTTFTPTPKTQTAPTGLIKQTQQKLAQVQQPDMRDPVSKLATFVGREFVAKPAAEIAATVTNNTVRPTNPVSRWAIGDTPIKPIQQDVAGTYNAVKTGHQNLPLINTPIPASLAAPWAAANAVMHVANDAPILGAVGKTATKTATKGIELAGKALDGASVVKTLTSNAPRVSITDQQVLRDFADTLSGAYKPTNSELNKIIADARQVGDKHGVDLTNGSMADRLDRATSVLDQVGKKKFGITPLNEVGAVGKDVRPVQSPSKPTQTPKELPKAQTGLLKSAQTVEQGQAVPSQPFNADKYITEQQKLQDAARGKQNILQTGRKEISTKMIDALSPIEKPVESVVGRSGALPLRNQLDRSLRADTIAGRFAKDNGLHDVINSVPDTKAFDQYLIARHAQDLEANGVKTGRNLAADQQLIDQLSPQYDAAAKKLSEYNNKLLDQTVSYGLISKDTAKYLKQKYPNYVPFDRIFSETELANKHVGTGGSPASLSKQTVIQRIQGSERQINSPLENILAKTHDVTAQGERNTAAKMLASTIKLKGNPLGLKELKPNEVIGNRPTISFLDNGVKRTFETTPEVAQAAKSLNKQQLGLIGKIFSYPTRALRLGATGINVGFTAANVVKDVATAGLNSAHPLHASVANPKVFMDALATSFWHRGKNYAELTRQGAGGTSFDIARNSAPSTIKKIRSERNVGTRVLYTVTHPEELLRAVEDTIGRSEEFGRALQYYGNKSAALKEGQSLKQATAYGADAARNNTTNFARAGEYGRVLNSVLPYFNAGLQGSRTFVRNMKLRPAQTTTKLVVGAFVPVAAVTAWNLNDPARKQAYDDIPDYEKQGNIIIIPPHPVKDPKTGRWNAIKIPVSQEVANANNVVRNGVEALQKDKAFDFKGMVADLTGTATSLNVGSVRQAENQVIPQAGKPLVELATNTNLYTGNKIVPDSKANLSKPDQYGTGTSGTAKVLGKLTNTSPYQIDNAVKTTFAGAGQNAVNASDNLLAKTGVIKPTDIKGTPIDTGITKRFYTAAGGSGFTEADKQFSAARDQLAKNKAFQALSQQDKAKELNRLQTDLTATAIRQYDAKFGTGQYAVGNTAPQKNPTKNQTAILQNGLNLNDYTKSTEQKAKEKTTPKTPKVKSTKVAKAKTTKKSTSKKSGVTKANLSKYSKYALGSSFATSNSSHLRNLVKAATLKSSKSPKVTSKKVALKKYTPKAAKVARKTPRMV